ncbi:MAG TPA: type II restriction endonuclease [Termitinemataceae bacterium]|nr:type II restriction endonuclease [Termitinemataceae bacterium]HOM24047.1 type II restriction endonuclease [Termitinemataceae bacterium]HPQ01514.1 type II restriction endonuclease [Termitinemataceae bacterium]
MNRITELLGYKTDDEAFEYILKTFENRTIFDWFVDWEKIYSKINDIEYHLNVLNYIIGKTDPQKALIEVISKDPGIVPIIPFLIASRERVFNILDENSGSELSIPESIKYDFRSKQKYPKEEIQKIADFFLKSGLNALILENKIKNFVDYMYGIEVGLDSNARKNRSGILMEKIVGKYFESLKKKYHDDFCYCKQANNDKIERTFSVNIEIPDRTYDFAIRSKDKLFLMEVNYYTGGGSKLNATAREYKERLNDIRTHCDTIDFIWITDGKGWNFAKRFLKEYYLQGGYLFNLNLLKDGILEKLLFPPAEYH